MALGLPGVKLFGKIFKKKKLIEIIANQYHILPNMI